MSGSNSADDFNELAFNYCRRARETGDDTYLQKANDAWRRSVAALPGNYGAEKIHVVILLGQHEFAQALQGATDLNKRVPDDIAVWNLLAEANISLGNYADATKDAQWMLDLRSGNPAGVIQAAHLREISGDIEGALQSLDDALRKTSQDEIEERVWLMCWMARLYQVLGNSTVAADLFGQALILFPGYHQAVSGLATVRSIQEKCPEATALLEQLYRILPTTPTLYRLAVALDRCGRGSEAVALFREFVTRAQKEADHPKNANIELIFYDADRAGKPGEALELARREITLRHDVRTGDAYAWALYRHGDFAEAQKQVKKILEVGTRDPVITCHAQQIQQAHPSEASGEQAKPAMAASAVCAVN